MSDALDVLDQVGKWKASGKGVAVATVITTWGSSPRPVGSQLGVDDTGAMVGSVSGGCIEGAVVKEALASIADGKPRLLDFGVTDEQAWDVGLACGGKGQGFVEKGDWFPEDRNRRRPAGRANPASRRDPRHAAERCRRNPGLSGQGGRRARLRPGPAVG